MLFAHSAQAQTLRDMASKLVELGLVEVSQADLAQGGAAADSAAAAVPQVLDDSSTREKLNGLFGGLQEQAQEDAQARPSLCSY